FGALLKSYERVIWEITNAFDAATTGFTDAQVKQAQADAIKAQIIGALATVGVAATFEWAFTSALGKLGGRLKLTKDQIEAVVEKVEKPVNAAASGASNVYGAKAGADSTNQRQAAPVPAADAGAPTAMANPMAFLSRNQADLAEHGQKFEQAFEARAADLEK